MLNYENSHWPSSRCQMMLSMCDYLVPYPLQHATMSHKRKAINLSSSDELPVLSFTSLHNESFPTELFIRIGSYWTGKELSTYLLATSACNELKDHVANALDGVVKRLADRCLDFLNEIDAPDSMRILLTKRVYTQDTVAVKNRSFSMDEAAGRFKWCDLLDYFKSMPLRLSEARLEQSKPVRQLSIIGFGTFATRTPTHAILSVPNETWRPELSFLGEKWMVDFPQQHPRLRHGFFTGDAELATNIGHTAAVMSWDGPDFLEIMHLIADIEAGMLVYHQYPDDQDVDDACFLNWHSRPFCNSILAGNIRTALGQSNLKWMVEGTESDYNTLTTVEINDLRIPNDYMNKFSELIVKLTKEVEKWYSANNDDESSGED